mmetsp:Transcript_2182/g.4061  ORF Transcript_2182/g.4061 Transcript_2182/m.4061 type:complete len:231 (-) Transcript_2182:325-1017(-)|eukprot:CAMPEP_0196659158 /NCGR_PEP_ID=MMETSP1086-20130531/33420_1 /TAXON_ID=77921 /ORGANISM="Cyanoptyche  gloeocystis , Strain SAG4.97" /LENGTH=230 /DNA_ID=CAMNT_0041993019 /DNA_START=27 /DNA_END=719 /DNA_ORIENTATION=-
MASQEVKQIDTASAAYPGKGNHLSAQVDKKIVSGSVSRGSGRISKIVLRRKADSMRTVPLMSLSSLSGFDGEHSPVPFLDTDISKIITPRARSLADDLPVHKRWPRTHVRQIKCRLDRSPDLYSAPACSPPLSPLRHASVGPSALCYPDTSSLSFPEELSECESEIEEIYEAPVVPSVQVRERPKNPVGRFLASLGMQRIEGDKLSAGDDANHPAQLSSDRPQLSVVVSL